MSEIANRLRDQRLNLVNEYRTIVDAATEESRDFSGEENGRLGAIDEQINKLDERIKGVLAQEQRAKDTDDAFDRLNGKPVERGKQQGDPARDELRTFMQGKGDRVYDVAVGGFATLRYPVEQRDVLTAAAGGVIDTGFRAQLWEFMIENAGILQAGVDMLETDSGETIKLPRATVHPTAAAQTEGVAITESDPTLSSVNSTVTKEGYVTQLSTELIADSGVDLTGYLARNSGRALGNAVGLNATTVAAAAAAAGATTAAGELTSLGSQATVGKGFDYLITLFHSVIAPYRASSSCAWLMSDPAAAMIRKVKSTDGVYAWQPSLVAGAPDTIFGKPVFIDTNVADPGANAESVLFGDWRSLVVRIAGGFRFERSDDFAFNADLVTFRTLVRHGAVSVDPNALKSLTHPAA